MEKRDQREREREGGRERERERGYIIHVLSQNPVLVRVSLYIMDTLGQDSVFVIQRCPLCGGYFIQ